MYHSGIWYIYYMKPKSTSATPATKKWSLILIGFTGLAAVIYGIWHFNFNVLQIDRESHIRDAIQQEYQALNLASVPVAASKDSLHCQKGSGTFGESTQYYCVGGISKTYALTEPDITKAESFIKDRLGATGWEARSENEATKTIENNILTVLVDVYTRESIKKLVTYSEDDKPSGRAQQILEEQYQEKLKQFEAQPQAQTLVYVQISNNARPAD